MDDDYESTVKEKAEELRKAAATARAIEDADERHDDDPLGPNNPRPNEDNVSSNVVDKYYKKYEWIETELVKLADLPDPKKSEPVSEALTAVVGGQGVPSSGGADALDIDVPYGEQTVRGDLKIGGEGKLEQNAIEQVGMVSIPTHRWGGNGAEGYKKLTQNLKPALHNQLAVGRSLLAATIVNHDILKSARKDMKDLLNKGIQALESAGSGSSDLSAQQILTIIGAAATLTVGITTLTPVAAAAGGAALTNAQGAMITVSGLTGLNSFLPENENKEENDLAADTVDDIVDKIYSQYWKIKEELDDASTELLNILHQNLEFISDYDGNELVSRDDHKKPLLVSPRPKHLVDAPESEVDDHFRPPGAPVPDS